MYLQISTWVATTIKTNYFIVLMTCCLIYYYYSPIFLVIEAQHCYYAKSLSGRSIVIVIHRESSLVSFISHIQW